MSPYESRSNTLVHIRRVNQLLLICCNELMSRAIMHDDSKLHPPESELLYIMHQEAPLDEMEYGSQEYAEALAKRKDDFCKHHYAGNSHHPEHYENGVWGMDIFDILEMFMDWKAAGEKTKNGTIWNSLAVNRGRYAIDPQLYAILENTARRMGW